MYFQPSQWVHFHLTFTNTIYAEHNGSENTTRLLENHPLPITKGGFESFPIAADFERFILSDEKEWYEDSAKYTLGVLCKDRTDDDWAYAILTKSDDGMYRWSDGEVSLHSRDEARKRLLFKMEST